MGKELILCYSDRSRDISEVSEGDVIPASQTECGRPVTIEQWSARGSQLIIGSISHLKRKGHFIAKELGLKWREQERSKI